MHFLCLSHRDLIKDQDTNTDGLILGTTLSRKAPFKGNYKELRGAHYSLLIWSLKYPVRQM